VIARELRDGGSFWSFLLSMLTEAAWLLRDESGGTKALGGLVQSGSVKLVELDESALRWIIAFLERYSSIGAQMADAAPYALQAGAVHFSATGRVRNDFLALSPLESIPL
jgi:hypothetical protein